MKHFHIFMFIAFIAIFAKANDAVDLSYFTDGMEWHTVITGTHDPNIVSSLETVTIEKCTGKELFKMYRYYNIDSSNQEFIAYIKSYDDKVFFTSDDSENAEWYLLYDFGMMSGDGCYVYSLLTMSDGHLLYKTYVKCTGINECSITSEIILCDLWLIDEA